MFLHLFCVIFYQYCIWGHGRAMGEYSLTSLYFKSWNNFQMKQNIHNCKTCSVCFVTWNARQRTESPCPNHYCTMVEGWFQTVAIYKIIKPKCHIMLTKSIIAKYKTTCILWTLRIEKDNVLNRVSKRRYVKRGMHIRNLPCISETQLN